MQVAAYGNAYEEMGHSPGPVDGLIVRLPKTESDPPLSTVSITAEEMADHFDTFRAVLTLWTAQQRFAKENPYRRPKKAKKA